MFAGRWGLERIAQLLLNRCTFFQTHGILLALILTV
jgi:hypothetical protein